MGDKFVHLNKCKWSICRFICGLIHIILGVRRPLSPKQGNLICMSEMTFKLREMETTTESFTNFR